MTILSVPDMTCGHCKAAVETALNALPDVGTVSVDLSAHRIEVSGKAPAEVLIQALDQAGYPATVAG